MTSQDSSQEPAARMYQRRERLTVALALPGAEPEDLSVEVTAQGGLIVRGRIRGAADPEEQILLDEWDSRPYYRELELPRAVNGPLANVTYSNGVLVVALPLAEHSTAALIDMQKVGSAHGERVGSHGQVPEPTTSEEHHAPQRRARGE